MPGFVKRISYIEMKSQMWYPFYMIRGRGHAHCSPAVCADDYETGGWML